MPWIQSHDTLPAHPKTRRAARMAGTTVPQMVGHLHLLWYWSLSMSDNGDLSRFDAADLADAAMYECDPDLFVAALMECGPGDSFGFLEPGLILHDWAEYGGRYKKRSEANRRNAETRWGKEREAAEQAKHATAMQSHSDSHAVGNAEERRGEERRDQNPIGDSASLSLVPVDDSPPAAVDRKYADDFTSFWNQYPNKVGKGGAAKVWKRMTAADRRRALEAITEHAAVWALWPPSERQFIPHPQTWLNQARYDDPAPTTRTPASRGKADDNMAKIQRSVARMGGGA